MRLRKNLKPHRLLLVNLRDLMISILQVPTRPFTIVLSLPSSLKPWERIMLGIVRPVKSLS